MRLTDTRVGYTKLQDNADIDDVVGKLGALEDIEDEFGIDLTTLFNALGNNKDYYFNKCGIELALTKEELL